MANITKKVTAGKSIPQYWDTAVDQNDTPATIAAGDVFQLETSLGKPAFSVTIKAAANITIRVNSYYIVLPDRAINEYNFANYEKNVANAVTYHDTSATPIPVASSSTLVLSNMGPIRNIELVATAGNFTLLAQ